MDLRAWDERYRSQDEHDSAPDPLLVETAEHLPPGNALDLACGAGRNALWLAHRGWRVTAVDGAPSAIRILQQRAAHIDARVADLEKGEFRIEPAAWDLIIICRYLQRDLFEPAKLGLRPSGVLLSIVLITAPGEEPSYKRLRPGELAGYFEGWKILHYREAYPVAEIVTSPAPAPDSNTPTPRPPLY